MTSTQLNEVSEIIRETELKLSEITSHNVKLDFIITDDEHKRVHPSMDIIIDIVAETLGLSVHDIKKRSRKRELVDARYIICDIAHLYTELPKRAIGMSLGGLDHATVLHGRNVVKDLLLTNSDFRARYNNCKTKIQETWAK